ncbi:MAG: hypothetical protein MUE65_01145 [Methanomassiliicoccales archaeon]|nr:hypothetical protein [Methanomassiliicoccales archaeon]
MKERRRIMLWASLGLMALVPYAVMYGSGVYDLGGYLGAWSLLIVGLVLLGMALTGLLRSMRGKALARISVLAALGAATFLFILMDGRTNEGNVLGIWGFLAFMAMAFLVMGLWQVLIGDNHHGIITESAYIDAAIVNLALSIVMVNLLRSTEAGPDNAKTLALILAFALVSTVMSLSALYSGTAGARARRYWVKPVAAALFLGLILPLLGVLVTFMTQGFSSST